MICNYCGAQLPDGSAFCTNCGASLSNAQPAAPVAAPVTPVYTAPATQVTYIPQQPIATHIPPEYEPLSPWAYVGYTLLFGIPLVGLIAMIVFACSSTGNINRKNYALSFIYLYVIAFVFGLILGIAGISILSEIMGSLL